MNARGRLERRGEKKRHMKPVILIVAEGSATEPEYFAHFRNRKTNIDIQIVGTKKRGGATDYASLVKKANERQKEQQLSPEYGDSVWVVADGDVNYDVASPIESKNKQLQAARKTAEKNCIQIAISNPCFELWYLLHFTYTTKLLKDYDAVIAEFPSELTDYEKTSDIFEKLWPHIGDALKNAERLEQYHIENGNTVPFGIGTRPYTDVCKLVQLLLG